MSSGTTARLLDLHGRVAMVTGAAQGFGYAIATRLADAGADVIVVDRTCDAAAAAAASIGTATGRTVRSVAADIADEPEVAELFASSGPIDVLVNNAGVFSNFAAIDLPVAEFDRILSVNLRGTFLCSRHHARALLASGRNGVIVNVASVDALSPSCEGQVHYTSSKHGVAGLTKALSVEWAPHGIRVNALAPAATRTPGAARKMAEQPNLEAELRKGIPLGRIAETADMTGPAVFLAAPASDFITGQTLYVDGGWQFSK